MELSLVRPEKVEEAKLMEWECIWPLASPFPTAIILEPLIFTPHPDSLDRRLFFSQTTPEGKTYRIEFKFFREELSGEIQINTTPWYFDSWSSYAIFRVIPQRQDAGVDFLNQALRLAVSVRKAQQKEPYDLTNPDDRVKLALTSVAHALTDEKFLELLQTTLDYCKDKGK